MAKYTSRILSFLQNIAKQEYSKIVNPESIKKVNTFIQTKQESSKTTAFINLNWDQVLLSSEPTYQEAHFNIFAWWLAILRSLSMQNKVWKLV